MLREDPLFELRLLEGVPALRTELAPGEVAPGRSSWNGLCRLQPPPQVLDILCERGIDNFWLSGYQALAVQPELEAILVKSNRDPREVSRALARALVASVIHEAEGVMAGSLDLAGDTRQQLVDLLVPQLGGQALGPFDWLTKPLTGLALRYGTYKARRERRALSDASYPVAGDILLYQARGETIRDLIPLLLEREFCDLGKKCIAAAPERRSQRFCSFYWV
jgi:hypothetical protein